MSENKLKSRDAIDAELKKTRTELTIAKHREMKLCNQIKAFHRHLFSGNGSGQCS